MFLDHCILSCYDGDCMVKRKRALIIVDIQPAFINKRNKNILKNIHALLRSKLYDLYITSTFHAEKGSIWDKQQAWTCPKGIGTTLLPDIKEWLKDKNVIHVEKETKSVF